MYTLPNVTFLGVEAKTPSDGVITISILGRGVGEVWFNDNVNHNDKPVMKLLVTSNNSSSDMPIS